MDDEEQRGATGGSSEGLPRNGIQKFDAAESPSTHRSEDNDEEGELFSSEEDEEFDKNVVIFLA